MHTDLVWRWHISRQSQEAVLGSTFHKEKISWWYHVFTPPRIIPYFLPRSVQTSPRVIVTFYCLHQRESSLTSTPTPRTAQQMSRQARRPLNCHSKLIISFLAFQPTNFICEPMGMNIQLSVKERLTCYLFKDGVSIWAKSLASSPNYTSPNYKLGWKTFP